MACWYNEAHTLFKIFHFLFNTSFWPLVCLFFFLLFKLEDEKMKIMPPARERSKLNTLIC